jgi:hypothetical protein
MPEVWRIRERLIADIQRCQVSFINLRRAANHFAIVHHNYSGQAQSLISGGSMPTS